ncbi:MAG TPA: cysteine desulfurase family protein [Stellaceae bacterium]|nr:cysteine desulfurase family protein [Stellaceae bacterium]
MTPRTVFAAVTTPRATYLDWNATAPLRAEVADAIAESLRRCGNPSSVHRWGRAARQALEAARRDVAALCGAAPDAVVFTSGGTEANQLALKGLPERRLIVSAIEHDSVRLARPDAAVLPALPDGRADLVALDAWLAAAARPALVSLMLANNETGAIQPVAEAARIAHAHGALLHCDAVQAAGKLPLDFRRSGADLLTLSAHKIGGPQGVGALVASPDLPLAPLWSGGGQERGRRAGTENLPGIIGFGAAARCALAGIDAYAKLAVLRDAAERRLLAIAPGARSFAATAPRLANTLCIAMPSIPAATQVMALDLAGVMVSAGSACSSGKLRRSHVLEAMGVAPDDSDCAIRVSLGWSSTERDIDHLVEAWGALYARRRASAA